jgi:hypothetical protein
MAVDARPFAGGVDIEPLADDAGRPAAVLDRLEPSQNLLGVGLANGEGSHALCVGQIAWLIERESIKIRLMTQQQPLDVNAEIARLVDGWCERRALGPLRRILGLWPPPNGFTDEWQGVWAALRSIRAMHRDELHHFGEFESISALIAEMSKQLYPQEEEKDLEAIADRLISSIFQGRAD